MNGDSVKREAYNYAITWIRGRVQPKRFHMSFPRSSIAYRFSMLRDEKDRGLAANIEASNATSVTDKYQNVACLLQPSQ